ncbi:MAG: dihydropteroate synthase [Rickettsiales bacterium]
MNQPKLVGIINITPDSFSDGGQCMDAAAALGSIRQLISDGADIIDIGAESTRPGATALSHKEEWQRLEPVLKQAISLSVPVSVDTRHAETAHKALALGVAWINDVSGFTNPAMIEAVKNAHCKLVIMHSLTVPADKNVTIAESDDVIEVITTFAEHKIEELQAKGIARDRIIFDPGIGFGKTPAQSQEIVNRIADLGALGVPLYIGHSRKSFFQFAPSATLQEKDEATLTVSKQLAKSGVEYLRVHNVKLHKEQL